MLTNISHYSVNDQYREIIVSVHEPFVSVLFLFIVFFATTTNKMKTHSLMNVIRDFVKYNYPLLGDYIIEKVCAFILFTN